MNPAPPVTRTRSPVPNVRPVLSPPSPLELSPLTILERRTLLPPQDAAPAA